MLRKERDRLAEGILERGNGTYKDRGNEQVSYMKDSTKLT
jgi:hypothetical protein